MVVYSLGKLQLQPPAPLLLNLQAASAAALSQLPPAGLIMLTDGLHMLRVKQPSMTWQVSYLQAVQAKLQDCTARELPVLAVVLLRWKCVLPADWMQQYLEACEQQMWTMTAQVCVCGWGSTAVAHHWRRCLVMCCTRLLAKLTALADGRRSLL